MIIELLTNLFQAFMYLGCLYAFLDKPENIKKRRIHFVLAVIIYFGVLTAYTLQIIVSNSYITSAEVVYMLLMIAYAVFFLKGNLILRIVFPIIINSISAIISVCTGVLISNATGTSLEILVTESGWNRTICIIIANLTCALVYYLIVKLKPSNLKYLKTQDILSIIIMPITVFIIMISVIVIMIITEYDSKVIIYLAIISVSMVSVMIATIYSMIKISNNNEARTQLELSKQKEKLYKESILNSNKQVERMSKIKHDINNSMLCIRKLLEEHKYEEAKKYCVRICEEISQSYVPINTNNPILNAVCNVEQEKALALGIGIKYLITCEMTEYKENHDIVSIIGNMLDNAIEYIAENEENNRVVWFEIYEEKDMILMKCKNRINESVLKNNPFLITGKKDKENHGKGTSIIRELVERNGGDIMYTEENGKFITAARLPKMVNYVQ